MMRLLVDENFDQRILRGVQLRVPNLPYTVVQKTILAEASDPVLLQWATDNQLVLVTHDRATMLRAANQRLRSGKKLAGLVIVKKEIPLSKAIEDLVMVLECCTETDMENQVLFIPI